MLGFQEDLDSVFYGSDFAASFMRHRTGAAPQEVAGILGIIDTTALDERVLTSSRTVRMPSCCDVRAGDVLEVLTHMPAQGVPTGTRYRVMDTPERVNDGAEMEAQLGCVPSA